MSETTNNTEVPSVVYTESDAYLKLNDVDSIIDKINRDNKLYMKGCVIFYTEVRMISLARVDDDKYILRFVLPYNRENVHHNVCIGYSKLHRTGEVSLLGVRFDDIEGIEFDPIDWKNVKEIISLSRRYRDLIRVLGPHVTINGINK